MTAFVSVYITAASQKEARALSRMLIEKRLAACASIFPVESTYRWKGKVRRSGEFAVIAKARGSSVRKLAAAVKEIHSYSVPCVVAWPIAFGDAGYMKWVKKETR